MSTTQTNAPHATTVSWLSGIDIGRVFSAHGGGRVRRDSESTWTMGRSETYTSGDIGTEIEHVEGDVIEAAKAHDRLFPESVAFNVSCEDGRRRFAAECSARNIRNAETARLKSNRLTADLRRAMSAAGCTCLFLFEPHTEQGGYGNHDGYAVYADSQAAADRVAAWLMKYGGYAPTPVALRHKPAGAPFAAFAPLDYYSIGD